MDSVHERITANCTDEADRREARGNGRKNRTTDGH